jgi:uncharacterized Tic20 family protein
MATYRPRQRHRAARDPGPAPREIPDRLILAPAPPGHPGRRLAMLCYLGLPFIGFLAPLACYLASGRRPAVRGPAARALNLWITVLLYTICGLIIGAMLALDSLAVALIIVTPAVAALWLVTLRFLIRAAVAANRDDPYRIPAWICATVFR